MELAQNDIFSASWCNIVFDGRNKEYGAYELRKRYAKNALLAVIIAITAFILSVSSPMIIEFFSGSDVDDTNVKIIEANTLSEPPPMNPDDPPPPPPPPPPPLKTTVKFTAPVIVEDKEVTDTVRTQEELKDVDVGAKTQEGDSTGVDASLIEDATIGEPEPEKIFTVVEQMPSFQGGEAELFKYLASNVKYPAMARETGITGTVYLSFVINKEGKVSDIKVLKGIGGGCDEEAVRVVKGMPSWKAGKQNGTPVSVQFTLPIKFTLR